MQCQVMENIDYDYRKNSKKDPDADSLKLYQAHQILWSKMLPIGKKLELKIEKNCYNNYVLENNISIHLTSDRMCPHFVKQYREKYNGFISTEDEEYFQYIVRTIGGHIIFPGKRNMGPTINQSRGIETKIRDRFDLTLECIRKYYLNEDSVLYKTLIRYNTFFDMFVDFKGYIDFFLLQDFVYNDYSVNFSLPLDNFERDGLPKDKEEYCTYKNNVINQILLRNKRIADYCELSIVNKC